MLRRLQWAALLITAFFSTTALGQNPDLLPAYKPVTVVSGKLVAWGNPEQKPLWERWREGFSKFYPNVQFAENMKSSATISGALFTGTANIGVAGREIMPIESLAFRNIFNYEVYQVVSGSGTFDTSQSTPAIGVFVNSNNPLGKLTMTELDAIFGKEHRRGARENIRTWGQLGLTGDWADKPIHVYGHDVEAPATAYFFAMRTFNGSSQWTCDLQQFGELRKPDGTGVSAGERILDAVANDRYGIGYTGFDHKNPGVKSVALAPVDGGPYVAPTRENAANRTYPLTRNIYLFVNRDPHKGFDRVVREFLRYVLSREGQQAVRDAKYLPLTDAMVSEQLRKLE